MADILHSSDASFEEDVLKSKTPVLVDFWAPWCGPCKAIAPVLSEIAAEYGDRLKVVKINVDDNPVTPAKYGVRGIPTLSIVKDGQVVSGKSGAISKSVLKDLIDPHV